MSAAELDRALLIFARTHGHNPALERVVSAYSRLGEHGACWIALGLGGAVLRGDRRWLRGGEVVAGAYVLNQAIKLAVGRPRPALRGLPPLTPTVTALSFPSAHATTSFAAAETFRGLLPAAVLYPAALAFAASRPYLGVHYPSDVVAGAALGSAIAKLARR